MPLLSRLALILTLAGAASGCQLAPPGTGRGNGTAEVTPNAVAGAAIEVTALEAPAPPAAPPAGAEALAAAAVQDGTPEGGPQDQATDPVPAPLPEAAGQEVEVASDADPEATPEPEAAPPEPPKSDLQVACERKRGTWADAGAGRKICLQTTRDGGKSCTRESQCDGACLARSGTCSPVAPLLGCNEILQDNGARVTLCIE